MTGTVKQHDASMGVLILGREPSQKMEVCASNYGQIEYMFDNNALSQEYDRIQIITAEEIIDGKTPSMPPDMQTIKFLRDKQLEGHSLF